MAEETMVERVAKALFDAVQPNYAGAEISWDTSNEEWGDEDREGFRQSARAAIEALREPTPAMTTPHLGHHGFAEYGDVEAAAIWREMIDAALKERANG